MKFLISDLDGTLYPKNREDLMQRRRNFEAVRKWVEKGNKFAVATARGTHHCALLEKELGFPINYIGSNGASVVLETKEEIIKSLPCRIFIDLCRFAAEKKIDASITTGLRGKWIWSRMDGYPKGIKAYETIWDAVELADLNKLDPDEGIQRIQIFTPPSNRNRLKELLLAQNLPGIITVSDEDLIDIGPLNSSKGIAISECCQRYGIDLSDLIVIGDSENDLAMFEITEQSYCLDHAEKEVKSRAGKIVRSVEEAIYCELEKIRKQEETEKG